MPSAAAVNASFLVPKELDFVLVQVDNLNCLFVPRYVSNMHFIFKFNILTIVLNSWYINDVSLFDKIPVHSSINFGAELGQRTRKSICHKKFWTLFLVQ